MKHRPVETTLYSLADAPPAPGNRRDGERHLTLFRVGSLTVDGRRELCLIKNISAGGMMVRAYCPIATGAKLSVELKCGESVSGIARWVEGDSVGISFDEPIDVVELLSTSMEGPRPRMPRIEVNGIAWVRQDGDVLHVRACDISQGGVKIESDRTIVVGGEVTVTLPGLPPQPGVVRWQQAGSYGITFNKVIPLQQLVGWLQGQRDRLRAAG